MIKQTEKAVLERRITALQALQDRRIAAVAERTRLMNEIVQRKQRELDNLRAMANATPTPAMALVAL